MKEDEMGEACSTHGYYEKCTKDFGRKTWKGEKTVGRPRHRWEDNIRMDLSQIGWDVMDWMHLVQDRDWWRALEKTVINLRVL